MNQRSFTISRVLIWVSSLCIGVLASVPKILRLNLPAKELAVDISIASSFAVFCWYFNLWRLPRRQPLPAARGSFFNLRLVRTLLLGFVVMFVLGSLHQRVFPYYHFLPMLSMYEFRALVINLIIYLFIYLLFQESRNQSMSVELEKARAGRLEAQFELLKQQVNPHFLFNSLSTLKSMVEMGDSNAPEFIVRLSDFYRWSLETRNRNLIRVSEELEVLEAYMFLLKARFEEGIDLTVQLEPAQGSSLMPAFTLQLLMENCIKHNVISPDSVLRIRIYPEGEWIVVANNLQVRRGVGPSTGTGLKNISDRYRRLQQRDIVLLQEAGQFIVKLPVIYEDSDHRG